MYPSKKPGPARILPKQIYIDALDPRLQKWQQSIQSYEIYTTNLYFGSHVFSYELGSDF